MKTSITKLMRGICVCATIMVLMYATTLHAQKAADTTGSTAGTTSTFTTFTTTDSTTTTASDASVDTSLPPGVSTAANVFDPGPRPGTPTSGAGHPIANMPIEQTIFWVDGLIKFGTTVTPKGANDSSGNPTLFGLGPSFNGESCLQCHSQPNIGGTSPQVNPQLT